MLATVDGSNDESFAVLFDILVNTNHASSAVFNKRVGGLE